MIQTKKLVAAFCLALAGLVACSSDAPGAKVPDGAGPDAAHPKNAADIAVGLIGGKVSTFVAVDRVRKHPVGPRILAMPLVADMLDGTGIDPLKDLERVFVTGPSTNSPRLVLFAEHNLDKEGQKAAMKAVLAKSDPPGQMIPAQDYDAAKVTIKKRVGVVAFVPPHFLVVVPEDLAGRIGDFSATGGLPDLPGPEAVVSTAFDPGHTVKGPRVPNIPETISKGSLSVLLKADGGADVNLEGDDASPDAAASDATTLTEEVERATTVKVAIMTVRAFDPIKFKAEGTNVKGHLALTQDDLERIVGLAEMFAQ